MSALEKMFGEDLVWSALTSSVRGMRRAGNTGFTKINCPMCVARGETQDKKGRCGIKYDASGIGVHCFNCRFRTRFKKGDALSKPMQQFLEEVGVPPRDVAKLKHWAFTLSRIVQASPDAVAVTNLVPQSFPAKVLPGDARPVEQWAEEGCDDPEFVRAVEYLGSRGDELLGATTYYWTPDPTDHLNRRLIVPCYHDGIMVGWTGRATHDDMQPRYHNETPSNYLFNSRAMTVEGRECVVIVEGIFDALALDALGTGGARLNETQCNWLNNCGKRKIVLADRDKAGQALIDAAIYHGWDVSFPRLARDNDPKGVHNWWGVEVKDAAQAVQKYGRLFVLRSVLASATSNKMQIALKRKWLS